MSKLAKTQTNLQDQFIDESDMNQFFLLVVT